MAEAVATYFPLGTRLSMPAGGLTLWIELPDKLPSMQVFEAALQEGILIAPGSMFSNSSRFDHFVRVSCGWRYTDVLDDAVRRLGRIVGELTRSEIKAA